AGWSKVFDAVDNTRQNLAAYHLDITFEWMSGWTILYIDDEEAVDEVRRKADRVSVTTFASFRFNLVANKIGPYLERLSVVLRGTHCVPPSRMRKMRHLEHHLCETCREGDKELRRMSFLWPCANRSCVWMRTA
ncbi:hypothetical protein FOZ63_032916, partial [Perkinsus olseni]